MGALGTNSGADAERGTAGVSAFNLAGLASGTNSAAFGLKDILLGCDQVNDRINTETRRVCTIGSEYR